MRPELLSERTVALAGDCLVVRDSLDAKTIHLFDPKTGKPTGDQKLTHKVC